MHNAHRSGVQPWSLNFFLRGGIIMGQRSLRAKIVKQLIWHKSGSKMGFLFCHWLEVVQKWVQSGFRGLFLHKIGPETHSEPTFEPLPANDKKAHF